MNIIDISVLSLVPAEYNPRRISDWEMRKLIRSIESFGFVEPIVVNKDMTIIGGHQRVEAAKSLGMEFVPCVVVDLPKAKEKALNVALNRIGGEFDDVLLAALLQEMDEEGKMLSGLDEKEIVKALEEEQKKEEKTGEMTCETCGQRIKTN